jgi:hypothetical protein
MRALRIAVPAQLMLSMEDWHAASAAIWSSLPEANRQAALAQLARLIRGGSLPSEPGPAARVIR